MIQDSEHPVDKLLREVSSQIEYLAHYDVTAFSRRIGRQLFSDDEERTVRQLHVEWIIDHWAALELNEFLPVFDRCYTILEGLPRVRERPFDYNDLDCHVRVVAWPGKPSRQRGQYHAITHEDQNLNFVYVRQMPPMGGLAIYRYWKMPTSEERREWTKARVMKSPEWVEQYFSDGPEGAYGFGPNRPTLEWLVEHHGSRYNDLRDGAWVATTADFIGSVPSGLIGRYHLFTHALFNLECLDRELGR